MTEDQDWASMPQLPPDLIPSSFDSATLVKTSPTEPYVYTADIKRDWCIGQGKYSLVTSSDSKKKGKKELNPNKTSQFRTEAI